MAQRANWEAYIVLYDSASDAEKALFHDLAVARNINVESPQEMYDTLNAVVRPGTSTSRGVPLTTKEAEHTRGYDEIITMRPDYRDTVLHGTQIQRKSYPSADFGNADLSGMDLRGAGFVGAHMEGADLSGANLKDADLKLAKLRNADLSGANLAGADLAGADLAGAVMTDVVWDYKTDIKNTALFHTDFSDVNLKPGALARKWINDNRGRVGGDPFNYQPEKLELFRGFNEPEVSKGLHFDRHVRAELEERLKRAQSGTPQFYPTYDEKLRQRAAKRQKSLPPTSAALAETVADDVALMTDSRGAVGSARASDMNNNPKQRRQRVPGPPPAAARPKGKQFRAMIK